MSKMKGILLAGGSGSRLYPMTQVVSKQLMPVYDKPMVYYPLSTLLLGGLREVLIITTPHDLHLFKKLLGTGEQWGMKLSYAVQAKPEGLAQALIIADDFLNGSPSCLILGDNIFHGHGLSQLLQKSTGLKNGALIYGYRVKDPSNYGVVDFDDKGNVLSIEEKPNKPKSKYAVPGIYFFDQKAPSLAVSLKPSARGELEVTDLNKIYLNSKTLQVKILGRGYAWLDTGTQENLLHASNFIQTIVERQGTQIGCLEEIAFARGYIDKNMVYKASVLYKNSSYGQYLEQLIS
jgi:glucose-1-phosphate thymidylyltransferase